MSTATVIISSPEPTEGEISQQLERILVSSEFQAPERGRKFLQFIVGETVAGRERFLKAFTIANEVFGRKASFDAQNDPVVRMEAGRIRRALERYYLVAGCADRVVITIPKGRYVPHFEYADDPATPCIATAPVDPAYALELTVPKEVTFPSGGASLRPQPLIALALAAALLMTAVFYTFLAPTRPVVHQSVRAVSISGSSGPKIIVGSFDGGGRDDVGTAVAHGLRDEVLTQLARFNDIVVVADLPKTEQRRPAGYGLQGSIHSEGTRLRAIARLVRQSDGAVIWANSYDIDLHGQGKIEIQADLAERIAGAVAQPYGAVFQVDIDTIARQSQSEGGQAYACTLTYYSYRRSMTVQGHDTARDCLQQATQAYPNNANAWALLSLTYLDELRFRYKLNTNTDRSLELAARAAEKAVSLAPRNTRALQATMLVSFFRGDIDGGLKAGAAAFAANPNDAEAAGEYGLRLSMSGDWQSGCKLISNVLNKISGPEGYYEVGMALCELMKGDLQTAKFWSHLSNQDYNPMHRLVRLSILGAAGEMVAARQEADWLNANAPGLMKNIRREIELRLRRTEDQEKFFSGLRASGVAIDAIRSAER